MPGDSKAKAEVEEIFGRRIRPGAPPPGRLKCDCVGI
jgi:hypothetical protein